ncbi:MAG: hypothetical protein L6R38_001353 [Xanthoria sp. 2 TBL-2021]|nr:MAG: hypothetical protein L6R38_001353 [Xanthoria sp. 2 TBL-2021]
MGKSKKPKPAATDAATQPAESPHEPAEPSLPSRPNVTSPICIQKTGFANENCQQPESSNEAEETDFETFYLKQVTTEFADDLDKLRNASDFTERSMPVLIEALKDTARTYSEEDKAKVMGLGQ